MNDKLASGIRAQLNKDAAFSQTQAAWRFFNNENTNLLDLAQPILKACHELCEENSHASYALVAHDWSHLSYGHYASKQDSYNTIKKSIGYELQTSLPLSAEHGGALGVVAMSLKDKNKLHRSYANETHRNVSHLDELAKQIEWIESQSSSKKLIHIIDREGIQ